MTVPHQWGDGSHEVAPMRDRAQLFELLEIESALTLRGTRMSAGRRAELQRRRVELIALLSGRDAQP